MTIVGIFPVLRVPFNRRTKDNRKLFLPPKNISDVGELPKIHPDQKYSYKNGHSRIYFKIIIKLQFYNVKIFRINYE